MNTTKYKPGDELIHKATRKRCVVISTNEDGTLKVRNEDNKEYDYYPQELRKNASGLIIRNKLKKKLY